MNSKGKQINGKVCPKCGNNSVFEERIYKFLGLVYLHTIEKCEIGPYPINCDYYSIKIEE